MPLFLEAQKSIALTNYRKLQPEVTTNRDFIAWDSYTYLIKNGVFYSKDVKVMKAKLAHWDSWFSPHPFKNRFDRDWETHHF